MHGGQRVRTPYIIRFTLSRCPADYDQAYQHFITALKRSPLFAPAFSDLGVYYLEAANPPDPNRASKCFQKAFELDATQADSARRLAESFAEEREWDLVEAVARRTIEGEGGNEQTTPNHLPVNSWAWKALGVVELVSFSHEIISSTFEPPPLPSRIAKTIPPRYNLFKYLFAENRMTRLAGSGWVKRMPGPADTRQR